jgi:N-methylhydantoinase B/oxoprolinase/acetone carboxylase alpha subunit
VRGEDELRLDILWPRLIGIADEMATTLVRTAFTHDVIEVHDMSTGLYDDRGHLVAQTWLGAVGHVGVMPYFGKTMLAAFPPSTIRSGDVFVCNDPWLCNGQTADVFIMTPAFRGDRLIGFSVTTVHHMDIGGRRGSGASEEVYEEGLLIPPLRLYREGRPNEDVFAILQRNVRFSDKVIGDFRAQVAAGWVGVSRLEALAREYGLGSFRAVADEIVDRTETSLRRGIAVLPDGTYRSEVPLDLDGFDHPLRLALALTVRGDGLSADFTGTSPQVRRPINSPINYTRAWVAVATKLVCDPSLPNNEGTYRPLTVSAPEGSLLNPTYPAATFWRISAGTLVAELMFRALAQVVPERVPADSGSLPVCQFYVAGRRRAGLPFALHQHAFGGMGGRPGQDGLASVSFPYNVRDVSTEWSEAETPILFDRRQLIIDSGGAGRWRGGLGEELVLRAFPGGDVDPATPLTLSGSAGRMRFPPQGLLGGGPGERCTIHVNGILLPPTSSPEILFGADDVVHLRLPGGGGYGDPHARDRRLIEWDLKNEHVTREAAHRDYGWLGEP